MSLISFVVGGHSTFFGLLNTFVHIIMYSYYLFSALGQPFHRYVWWKKYVTALQMVRSVAFIHSYPFHLFDIDFNDCCCSWINGSNRCSLLLLWCMRSNYCSSIVIIHGHSFGGLVYMLLCSSFCSMNFINQHTNIVRLES